MQTAHRLSNLLRYFTTHKKSNVIMSYFLTHKAFSIERLNIIDILLRYD